MKFHLTFENCENKHFYTQKNTLNFENFEFALV